MLMMDCSCTAANAFSSTLESEDENLCRNRVDDEDVVAVAFLHMRGMVQFQQFQFWNQF